MLSCKALRHFSSVAIWTARFSQESTEHIALNILELGADRCNGLAHVFLGGTQRMRPARNVGAIIDIDALIVLGERAHGPIINGEDDAR